MHKFLIAAVAATATLAATASAETLKMATIAPSLSQAITMATFANVVNSNLDDINIEVAGGGAATLHQVEVAKGNLDFSMTSPVIYNLMTAGKAMYAKQADAPELARTHGELAFVLAFRATSCRDWVRFMFWLIWLCSRIGFIQNTGWRATATPAWPSVLLQQTANVYVTSSIKMQVSRYRLRREHTGFIGFPWRAVTLLRKTASAALAWR